jgi:ion channel-forming bestrophin family protein
MIVRKNLKWSIIIRGAWRLLLLWGVLSGLCYALYFRLGYTFIALPFAPIAVLGTALSIFLGFRNSSSYDRWWEARTLWGGVVNQSRTFSRQVITFCKDPSFHRELIFRHLAWVNALRLQLRGQMNESSLRELSAYLEAPEIEALAGAKNKTSQLLLAQGKRLAALQQQGLLDDFRHMQIDNTLTELYNLQGGNERIKNTPLPRQYNFFNLIFMHLFVFLLPFGLLRSFEEVQVPSLIIPFCMVTGFVFYIVEGVGRRIEDPFENRITDVPLTALCRTIEIDLKQMLGLTDIPEKAEPVDGFLY